VFALDVSGKKQKGRSSVSVAVYHDSHREHRPQTAAQSF
jgi:hypothetical protein